jgi:multiple sugar transport system substrate-binding protein
VACWSGPEHDNLVKLAEAYTEKTGNKVTVEEIAREAYYDKLTTTFVAGSDDYDAAYIMSDWPPAWIKAEGLKDLDSFINDPKVVSPDFKIEAFEPSINYFKFDGKTYAFPSEGDTAWLWYRKDLFEAKGLKVPETWDEFYETAKALNNPPEVYGALIAAKPDEAWWDFGYYFFSFGGDILDKDFNPTINSEAGVAALEYYAKLLKDGLTPPDVATYGYNEVLTTLQEGKAAMGVQWMAATMTLTDCAQSPKVCKDGQPLLGYAHIPGIKGADGKVVKATSGSQWGWGIPSGSTNQEAAYKFIEWLTSKEGAKMWAINGGIPGNNDALSDPDVVALIPQFKMLAEAMPGRHIFPPVTVTPELLTIANEAIVAAVTGTKDAKTALDDGNAKMVELMKKAGYIK